MKWFCKYWVLYYKYLALKKEHDDLVSCIDTEIWEDRIHE